MKAQQLSIVSVLLASASIFSGPLAHAAPVARDDISDSRFLVGPSIVEPSKGTRNIFPAANFNRNVSSNWWDTDVLDGGDPTAADEVKIILANASIIVFHEDMYGVLGVKSYRDNKTVERIFDFPPPPSFASRSVHDGTVYSPECNCIFFAELHPPEKGFSTQAMPWVWRVNLNGSAPVTEKVYPSPQLTVGNGAYYHKGYVYWAQEGNYTVPGGIVRMDPLTLETKVVLNNYLGHRFNSPNDVVITRDGVAYFTDGYYGFANFNDTIEPELANGVWRWEMSTGDVRKAASASAGTFLNPNGVALNAQEDKLYVTARGETSASPDGQRTVYDFDISGARSRGPALQGGNPLIYSDAGFPDGVKVDAEGRIYGGVTGGVDVHSPQGVLLGKIKVANTDVAVNMQFVDSWLYIAGRDSLYRVQLDVLGAQSFT